MKDRSHDRFESRKIRGEMFEIAQDPHDETDTLRNQRFEAFADTMNLRYTNVSVILSGSGRRKFASTAKEPPLGVCVGIPWSK